MSELIMTIDRDRHGNLIINSNFGREMKYMWYGKREAVRMYRHTFHAVGKRIETYDYTI